MSVTAPAGCSTSSLTWGAAVRSDGLIQFLLQLFGLGNLPLDAAHSALGTTVSDSCSLQFATEPQNVMVGQPVTASAFDPSGAPVSVDVVDASGQIVTGSTAPVTVALQNGGVATLGGTATQTASGGVATFADLTVSAAGSGFALSATSPGLAGATSTPFGAQNQATACSGPSCTTTAGNTQGSAQVLATAPGGTSGTLTESVNVQGEGPLTCGSYVSADPNTYDFMTTNQALSKTITITITDPQGQLPPVGRVLATQQICFQASYDFIQQGGGLAPQGTLPDGSTVFTGLLPSCNDPNSGPCHDRASDALMTDPASPTGYDIVLVASIPAAPGDPRMN